MLVQLSSMAYSASNAALEAARDLLGVRGFLPFILSEVMAITGFAPAIYWVKIWEDWCNAGLTPQWTSPHAVNEVMGSGYSDAPLLHP